MLVLARQYSEKIILRHTVTGEVIELEQREIRGSISRLGITAGQQWKILRGELLDGTNDPNHPDFGKDYA